MGLIRCYMILQPPPQVPLSRLVLRAHLQNFDGHWRDRLRSNGLVLEAWSEGFMLGALVVMACLTVAALRKGILLHKLILLEQILAMPHATFCFMTFSGYSWYVSSTAVLLYCSYILHNLIAWIKVKPFFVGDTHFFSRSFGIRTRWIYLSTLYLTIPLWTTLMVYNFRFNNNISDEFKELRPFEPLLRYTYSPTQDLFGLRLTYPYLRDPWWLFTNIVLLHIIAKTYGVSVIQLISRSPRLGILLLAVCLSLSFTLMDILASILKDKLGTVEGINPYWKLSLIFKCLADAIMLDDFKTELDRLSSARYSGDSVRMTGTRESVATLVQYQSSVHTRPISQNLGKGAMKKARDDDFTGGLEEIENTAQLAVNSMRIYLLHSSIKS